MSISYNELAGQILRVLNKSSKNPGMYTQPKVFDAIQEAIDYVAVEMFLADNGWLTNMKFIDTVANQVTVPITPDMSMIKGCRYLLGDIYSPLTYDDASDQPMYNSATGVAQYAYRYKVVGNQIYFNPVLAEGGPRYLQVEYTSFPRLSQDGNDSIEQQFNAGILHFIKYRSASILAPTLAQQGWGRLEAQWEQKMLSLVDKRNLQPTAIREFMG